MGLRPPARAARRQRAAVSRSRLGWRGALR